jgi:hypothetical protein
MLEKELEFSGKGRNFDLVLAYDDVTSYNTCDRVFG